MIYFNYQKGGTTNLMGALHTHSTNHLPRGPYLPGERLTYMAGGLPTWLQNTFLKEDYLKSCFRKHKKRKRKIVKFSRGQKKPASINNHMGVIEI